MTMRSRDLSQVPPDTAAVGQRLLPATNPYRVIGDQLADLLADVQFAALYKETGREAIWPSLLALVTVFQFLENIPDREAAEMVVVRLDWKYALHLPLDYAGFHYSDLCYFRQRVLEQQQEALIFEIILGKLKALGFVKKRVKQRTDSLAVLGAVRHLSVLETVNETLRLTLQTLEKTAPLWVTQTIPTSFCEQYARLRAEYRLTADERATALAQMGQDALWLLERIAATAPADVQALEVVTTLRTVWEQRYEQTGETVRLREKTVDCTALIVTPHDPGVRAGEKRGKGWVGEKVHVTETAEPGEPHFLTDVLTGNASGGDATALPEIRDRLAQRDALPDEQYVDSSYISGRQLYESQRYGIALLGPPLADTSPNGFKIAAFQLDRGAQRAICPAGQEAVKWTARTERDGSRGTNIHFAAATCAVCALRDRCTTGHSGRSLHISEHYELLEARRAETQTEAFRQKMRARPGIEATLSELVRQHGLRRHRYRGDEKRSFENLLKGAACNVKRLVRALVERETCGLRRRVHVPRHARVTLASR